MMLSKNKKGVSKGVLADFMIGLLFVTLLFRFAASLIPQVQTAGDELNGTGVVLGSLAASGGVIELAIMGGLLVVVAGYFIYKIKHKGK